MAADLPQTFVPGFHNENEVRKMRYNVFGDTGLKVSHLSLGTGTFCLQYGNYTIEECRATTLEALKSGINYIDTAPWYGHGVSETVLGKCLEGVPRQAYYIATKVGRYEKEPELMFDFSARKTRESIETSLKKLGVDYIDVLQVHDIEYAPSLDMVINETLPVLEDYLHSGKVKFIGVTGYPVSTLWQCIQRSKTKIDMTLSYTRLSLVDNTLREFLPKFQSKGLGVVNAAAHCMGLMTNGGPQEWHPANQEIKDICTEARNYCKANNIELARLALHYSFNQPGPHTHLVGVNTRQQLRDNLSVLFEGLNKKEKEILNYIQTKILSKLNKGHWEDVVAQQAAEINRLMVEVKRGQV